ncbi:MAG: biosynthetic-type acetolactate synthase large subunit [Oscillospiraceae bacterium]|nr:biosynthetic-type acetolactate synthase large subunit [Oscillospiraceae bacterium]
MIMTGARIIIETLIEQGCDTVFGYPGGQVLNIYDELYLHSDQINHILTAHEQGAAHAADGYARATGKTGVVIATSGPGATNLVTGIANAYLDSVPMVAITGNVPTSLMGRDSFQEADIMGITMSITKHNYIVKDVSDLADIIREAFMIASSGRPGPVLIDVPKDVQLGECEFLPKGKVAGKKMPAVSDEGLKTAAEMIAAAKKPYIYCGGGVVASGAEAELLELCEKMDAPVGCSMMGLSAIPADHKMMLGMQGMHGHFVSSKAKSQADLILAIGVRFSDRATGNKSVYAQNAKIIHIDADAAELNKNIPVKLGLVGDVKDALQRLLPLIGQASHPEWHEQIGEWKKKQAEFRTKLGAFSPKDIVETVSRYAATDAVIATDVGQHQMWAAQYYPFKSKRSWITSGGLGTMGFGMGAAIGAIVGSGKEGILFTGDGSFGMNLNEMATAVSQNLPLTIVLFNNGVLGMVRQWQTLFYDKRYAQTTLARKTDFVKLAEAFGATAFRAVDQTSLEEALEQAKKTDGPVLIDCVICEDEFVLPMTPPGGSINEIITERVDS